MTRSLTGRAVFTALRNEGRRVHRSAVSVTFRPDPEGTAPRVGFAVGRPVGSAVVRNRVRRRLRAISEELAAEGVLAGGDFLIGAGPAAVETEYGELREMVREAARSVVEEVS